MKVSWVMGAILVGHVSAAVASSPRGFLGERCFPERPVPCLTPLYEKLKATRDFSALKKEIRERFATGDERVRDATLGWIELKRTELTDAETADFEELYLEAVPNGPGSRGLRNHVATLRLSQLSQSQRAKIYWEAVRNGSVDIGGVDPLVRTVALSRAAGEGLTEFEGTIREYTKEINAGEDNIIDGHLDGRLLWQLKLRAGAEDAKDAEVRAAGRMAEMEDTTFRDLVTKDANFRGVVQVFQEDVCNLETGRARNADACKGMARVYLKQDALQRRLTQRAATATPGSEPKSEQTEPDWLVRLRTATREQVFAARQEEARRSH